VSEAGSHLLTEVIVVTMLEGLPGGDEFLGKVFTLEIDEFSTLVVSKLETLLVLVEVGEDLRGHVVKLVPVGEFGVDLLTDWKNLSSESLDRTDSEETSKNAFRNFAGNSWLVFNVRNNLSSDNIEHFGSLIGPSNALKECSEVESAYVSTL